MGNNLKLTTFTIIKPDAVKAGHTASILKDIADAGFKIVGLEMLTLSEDRASDFYYEHKGRPYFKDLIEFMTSGPIVVAALAGDNNNVVADYRKLMGATKVEDRTPDTLRYKYGTTLMFNALHGSDSHDNAEREIEFFFKNHEILERISIF
jgi:nucleoside-diphosphate kinase